DDPATSVSVWKPGDDAAPAASHNFRRICVKHAIVVRLTVLAENLFDLWIDRKAGGLEAALDHPEAAIRHDRTAERFVGLQADDHPVLAIHVARRMRGDRRGYSGVDVEHAPLCFSGEVGHKSGEHCLSAVG